MNVKDLELHDKVTVGVGVPLQLAWSIWGWVAVSVRVFNLVHSQSQRKQSDKCTQLIKLDIICTCFWCKVWKCCTREQVTTAFNFTSNWMTEWLELLLSQTLKANANHFCDPGKNCCIWNSRELKQWWRRRQVKLNYFIFFQWNSRLSRSLQYANGS